MKIEFKDLSFSYFEEGKSIIENFSAEFSQEKISLLTGTSGCGKSTLLYLAAGIFPNNCGVIRGGNVFVGEENIGSLFPKERSQRVGMMFQNPDLQFCMDTVRNEMVFCLENICARAEEAESRIDEALAFCEIGHLKHRQLHSLSGGEKQKVALACILLLRPKWLLLDEPFASIDEVSTKQIMQKLSRLHKEQGIGILAVDHRPELWKGLLDEIWVMEDGCVSKIANWKTEDYPGLAVDGFEGNEGGKTPRKVSLELKNFAVCLKDKKILEGVNFTFEEGKIYALLGESGSGKTSFFSSLSGVYPYDGEALLGGVDIGKNRKKLLGKMGFVTQNPQDQFVGGTVRQEVSMGIRGDAFAESERILRSISLWRYREISPYMLSQGQQRKLGVATLMAYDCKVLVCDEPTYAQDRGNTIAIMRELCEKARKEGITLIFSTHDEELAVAYSDCILRLEERNLHVAKIPHDGGRKLWSCDEKEEDTKKAFAARLNPAFKFIGLLLLTFVLAYFHHPVVNFLFFGLCTVGILASGTSVKKFLVLIAPILLAALGMFVAGYKFASGEGMPVNEGTILLSDSNLWNGLIMASRVLAFAGMGYLYCFTTDRYEMIRSFQKQLRLPCVLAYGLLAAWGIFPRMMQEYKRTIAAFRARGKNPLPFSPAFLRPLLVKSVRWSEALAAAMESKGFDGNAPRSEIERCSVHSADWVFLIICIVVIPSLLVWWL